MIKININGQELEAEVCKGCKEGWTKGQKGSCYMQSQSGGNTCQMDGCGHCMEFHNRIPEFGTEQVCFECAHGFSRGRFHIHRRFHAECDPWALNHCYTQ